MIFVFYRKHSIRKLILMLSLCFSISIAKAQTPDMPVSLHLKQADLKEFIARIEGATGSAKRKYLYKPY